MSRTAAFSGLALASSLALLAACKPPPTDTDITRDLPEPEPAYASAPLPSPVSDGAVWALSPTNADRLIYGVPGSPALLALTCLADGPDPRLRLTRLSPADTGAGALMALVGNGHMGRIEVDALEVSDRTVWRAEVDAADDRLEPLAGPRSLTVTVPGAGMVTIEDNALAMQFLEACRSR
jgi:hypothetical protein